MLADNIADGSSEYNAIPPDNDKTPAPTRFFAMEATSEESVARVVDSNSDNSRGDIYVSQHLRVYQYEAMVAKNIMTYICCFHETVRTITLKVWASGNINDGTTRPSRTLGFH